MTSLKKPIPSLIALLLAIAIVVGLVWLTVLQRGQALPAFSYPFHKTSVTKYNGGSAKQVGSYSFPVSKNMAGVLMELQPGGLRELHWHAFAAEWAYVISGRTRITLTSPEGEVQIADVDAGGLWYFPKGWGHSIEGLGPGTAKFMLVFNDGSFKEGSTFSITDWMAHTPTDWLSTNLGLNKQQLKQLPNKQVYISQNPPLPGPLATAQPRDPDIKPLAVSHVFNLASQPEISKEAGSNLRMATAKDFPASFNMTGALMHLEPGALRSMHWHPNADEWQFVLNGSADVSVFAAEGKSSLASLAQGDVGYVPMGYGHAIKNTSNGPTDLLLVFNDGEYQKINLNGWLASNPASVLGNNFNAPAGLINKLPKSNGDLLNPEP